MKTITPEIVFPSRVVFSAGKPYYCPQAFDVRIFILFLGGMDIRYPMAFFIAKAPEKRFFICYASGND